MASLATVVDLAARVPAGIGVDDAPRAQLVLDDASAWVRDAAGTEWDDADPPAIAVTLCLAASLRAWLNPDGLTSETIGSYTWRREATDTGVYLTDAEERRLRRSVGRSTGLWVQPLGRDPDTLTDPPPFS